MEYRIDPHPAPDEREAIERALRKLLSREALPAAYTSAWRKAGIRPERDQAVARPRSSWGARRA